MFTQLQIVNLGLSKIASSRVANLTPPVTSLEKFVHNGYDHWKRSELAKRRWVFALSEDYPLALVLTYESSDRPYKYALPTECLRPVRTRFTEWIQRKRFIHSAHADLKITFIENVLEVDFDALFVEVLACRVALESVEYVTQSNTKKADMKALYDEAVRTAGQANAFVIGPEDIGADDNDFSFLTARY